MAGIAARPVDARESDAKALDKLGEALCRFAGRTVCLSLLRSAAEPQGFYHIGWHDNAGGYFSGIGMKPSLAFEAAERAGPARKAA